VGAGQGGGEQEEDEGLHGRALTLTLCRKWARRPQGLPSP
jgi:hypothetical protein